MGGELGKGVASNGDSSEKDLSPKKGLNRARKKETTHGGINKEIEQEGGRKIWVMKKTSKRCGSSARGRRKALGFGHQNFVKEALRHWVLTKGVEGPESAEIETLKGGQGAGDSWGRSSVLGDQGEPEPAKRKGKKRPKSAFSFQGGGKKRAN